MGAGGGNAQTGGIDLPCLAIKLIVSLYCVRGVSVERDKQRPPPNGEKRNEEAKKKGAKMPSAQPWIGLRTLTTDGVHIQLPISELLLSSDQFLNPDVNGKGG